MMPADNTVVLMHSELSQTVKHIILALHVSFKEATVNYGFKVSQKLLRVMICLKNAECKFCSSLSENLYCNQL